MQIANPNKPGSFCHQSFSTYVTWYKEKTSEYLVARYASLMEDAQDYLRYSCTSMANDKFQAECISQIHEARFGTPLMEKAQ
jgi:hypothetical protein